MNDFNISVPTRGRCLQMMSDMQMMEHIVSHSLQVCRVALFLASQLNQNGSRLDCGLIEAAALLHDITKTRSFKTGENHAQTGGQFMVREGYPEVGDLVRQHVKLDDYSTEGVLREAEIINYADKRVLHDHIVDLDERLAYILRRYARTDEHRRRIHWLWEKTKALEKRIFNSLTFQPADIIRFIDTAC